MENYKSNSHRSKELKNAGGEPLSEKRVEKIVTGNVHKKKSDSLLDVFVPGDLENIKQYIINDVLVPTIKRAISDIVSNGVNMLLGETGRPYKYNNYRDRPSYRPYYDDRDDRRDYRSVKVRTPNRYEEKIIFDDRGDAEEVLYRMEERIKECGNVSVADFYDLIGLDSEYTDNKYGWDSLKTAYVERTRDGYIIRLPRATAL